MGLSGAILGCSSSVDTTGTTSSGAGSGGDGSGGAAMTTGVGGDTPGTTGSGETPSACPAITAFQVEIQKNNQPLYQDCSLPSEWTLPELVVRGAVTQSTASSFEVDACANIECKAPETYQVSLANLGPSSGVPFVLPVGTLVELRYTRFSTTYQCAYTLVVTNLPSLHGAANPTEPGSALWFQGQQSTWSKSAPVVGSFVLTHPCGAVHSDTYPSGWDLQVSAHDDPAMSNTPVQSGTVILWSPGTALLPGTYAVKNLTSVWTSVETLENNFVVSRAPAK